MIAAMLATTASVSMMGGFDHHPTRLGTTVKDNIMLIILVTLR
jgi:hypothetical protein